MSKIDQFCQNTLKIDGTYFSVALKPLILLGRGITRKERQQVLGEIVDWEFLAFFHLKKCDKDLNLWKIDQLGQNTLKIDDTCFLVASKLLILLVLGITREEIQQVHGEIVYWRLSAFFHFKKCDKGLNLLKIDQLGQNTLKIDDTYFSVALKRLFLLARDITREEIQQVHEVIVHWRFPAFYHF